MADAEIGSGDNYGWYLPGGSLGLTGIAANYYMWSSFVSTLQNYGYNVMLYASSFWADYMNNLNVSTVEFTWIQ